MSIYEVIVYTDRYGKKQEVKAFDPENPEAFNQVSWFDTRASEQSDGSIIGMTDEQANWYRKQKERFDHWQAQESKRLAQLPNPIMSDDSMCGSRERSEIALMTSLGRAIEKEGFTVKWMSGKYKGDYEVHPTWARYAKIVKDGQHVGGFTTWVPSSGYRSRPVGWVITTNRGVGNPNARYSNRSEKRVKKVETAVKYIVETAIPKRDFETEIKDLRKQISDLRVKSGKKQQLIQQHMDGRREFNSSDGMLRQLLEWTANGQTKEAIQALRERNQEINKWQRERTALSAEANEIERVKLEPLLEKARQELPDFYS